MQLVSKFQRDWSVNIWVVYRVDKFQKKSSNFCGRRSSPTNIKVPWLKVFRVAGINIFNLCTIWFVNFFCLSPKTKRFKVVARIWWRCCSEENINIFPRKFIKNWGAQKKSIVFHKTLATFESNFNISKVMIGKAEGWRALCLYVMFHLYFKYKNDVSISLVFLILIPKFKRIFKIFYCYKLFYIFFFINIVTIEYQNEKTKFVISIFITNSVFSFRYSIVTI